MKNWNECQKKQTFQVYKAWISLSVTRHSMHYILALTTYIGTCNLEKWTGSNAGTFHLCDSC